MTIATLDTLYRLVWGWPLLLLIFGLGLYLTIILRGLQFRYLGYALRLVIHPGRHGRGRGDISHFQSLMTSLAATMGIGNLAGVSTALTVGGFGAIFWMWVTALLGMSIKYGEALLAVKYREVDEDGTMSGGPMYFIRKGLGYKWLAGAFALFGAIASFGGGNMIQANSVADVLQSSAGISPWWSAIVMALIAGITLLGGIKSIGRVASLLVPTMGCIYMIGAGIVLVLGFGKIPAVLWQVISSAFSPQAAFGGAIGITIAQAVQTGISRGLMTSESGLGTASIAAAAAKTDTPCSQAMVSMTGSFLATVVMCTLTALVLGVTGVVGVPAVNGEPVTGASLTLLAFNEAYTGGGLVVIIATVLFGFTTLLGWAYYGEKCVEYLFGFRALTAYRLIFIACIIPGATLDLVVVWKIADIANGLMAYPNLIGVMLLTPVIVKETRQYLRQLREEEAKKEGGEMARCEVG